MQRGKLATPRAGSVGFPAVVRPPARKAAVTVPRTSRLAVALTAVLALAACGNTTRLQPTAHATPRVPPSVAPTVNPAPTTSAPASPSGEPSVTASASASPTGGSTGSGNAVKTDSTVNKFVPQTLNVKVGTKVTWTADQPFHSVTSGTPDKQGGPLNAPIGFTTYSYTFTKAGTYQYFCQPHASLGMVGEIVVK